MKKVSHMATFRCVNDYVSTTGFIRQAECWKVGVRPLEPPIQFQEYEFVEP